MYQYIAMTDVALLTDSYEYDNALLSLWEDVQTKRYVTGGMGVENNNESFGASYYLPTDGSYSETCGSIASVMWNYRMNLLYGDSRYADVMEQTLYNAVLDGVNFDGDKFFYQNPISSDGDKSRSEWFGCACCPPNLMRLIASLGGYLYAQDESGVYVNLYIGNTARLSVGDASMELVSQSEMPWQGEYTMTVNPESSAEFTLFFRLPDWAQGEYSITVNGTPVSVQADEQGYLALTRIWQAGDTVSLS